MTDTPHIYEISHCLIGSNAMTRVILSDGKIVHQTAKARLLRGKDTGGRDVETWLPNYWISQTLNLKHKTTFLLKRDREYDMNFKLL